MTRKSLIQKVTFEQNLEGVERENHANICGNSIPNVLKWEHNCNVTIKEWAEVEKVDNVVGNTGRSFRLLQVIMEILNLNHS